MSDYRGMFQSDYLGAWDLPAGKDVVVTIAAISVEQLTNSRGKKEQKPVLTFDGKKKGVVMNKTNCKTIAALYGNDTAQWIGKRIALYATQTQFGNDTVDCIRVRGAVPKRAYEVKPKPVATTADGEVLNEDAEDAPELEDRPVPQ